MTPESYGLMIALTFAALLLAALGALLLFKGAREDSGPPSLVLTDGRIRIGDGANVLRFQLEVQPSGRPALRAELAEGGLKRCHT
jgi:hypothetical protein